MRHQISLFVTLFILWLILSGMPEPLLISLGVVSCLLVVWIARRKDLIDHEGLPLHLKWIRWARYWSWLLGQIVLANIDVTRRILDPRLPISPCVIKVPAQMSDLSKVIYANSITLTPGTVSIQVGEQDITVHALTQAGAEELLQGEMGRRVVTLEEPYA